MCKTSPYVFPQCICPKSSVEHEIWFYLYESLIIPQKVAIVQPHEQLAFLIGSMNPNK